MDRDHTRRAGRGVRPAVVEAVDIQRASVDGCRSGIAAIAAREPLNACAVHDERAGPADHAAEVGGTCARGHGQGRTIQRDIAPCRAAPVQVRTAVVEAVKVQQYARAIAEGPGSGAERSEVGSVGERGGCTGRYWWWAY